VHRFLGSGALSDAREGFAFGAQWGFVDWLRANTLPWGAESWKPLHQSLCVLECGGGGDCLFHCVARGLNMFDLLCAQLVKSTSTATLRAFGYSVALNKAVAAPQQGKAGEPKLGERFAMADVRAQAAGALTPENKAGFVLEYMNGAAAASGLEQLREALAASGDRMQGDTAILHHLLIHAKPFRDRRMGFIVFSRDSQGALVCQPLRTGDAQFLMLLFCDGAHWQLAALPPDPAVETPKALPFHAAAFLPRVFDVMLRG
jgi:hypothetical protein